MSLRFYFDTHIAKAAALQLRAKGVDVIRCEEVGMADASDEEHLQYATTEMRIMVSQDDDFVALHVQWREAGRRHAGIMKVSHRYQGEGQISHLVHELLFYHEAEKAHAVDYSAEIANHVLYL